MKTKDNILEKEFQQFSTKLSKQITPAVTNLFLFTVNHKTAPVAIREKFSISEHSITEAIQSLKTYKTIKSFLILSTCNRTEVYFTSYDFNSASNSIVDFFSKYLSLEQKVIKEYSTTIKGNNVINHAFNLACGLDSLVIGEKQILSQTRTAYSYAQKEKTLDSILELLFQKTIQSAKEIHSKTNLSKCGQSISSCAIDLANKTSGPLKTKSVMILGAGSMARLALEHIQKIGGAKETVVLNKSPHKVIEFSKEYKIDRSFPFEDIYQVLNDVDILICAAGAPHFILFNKQFAQTRKDTNKQLHIYDLSMPRNIDSEFNKLPNVKLFDIDAIQSSYNYSLQPPTTDLKKTTELIKTNIDSFYKQLSSKKSDVEIKELKEKVETIRKEKFEKLTKNKDSFTKEEVEYITKNITNTLLHDYLKDLKSE